MSYVVIIFFYLLGVASGLVAGRRFCKWHHKNDVIPGDPRCLSDDACGPLPRPGTIGEEIGGCDQPGSDCK